MFWLGETNVYWYCRIKHSPTVPEGTWNLLIDKIQSFVWFTQFSPYLKDETLTDKHFCQHSKSWTWEGKIKMWQCNSLLMIASDSLVYSSERCWYFFKTEQEHKPPSAVELPVFGDTEGTSMCTRKGISLTLLQPFPWQNTSPCPDWFPLGECSSCWQWVVVMSWAFPWWQLLCLLCAQGPGAGKFLFSHRQEAALGLELWHFLMSYLRKGVSSERPWASISRLLTQRAPPAAQMSGWDATSYLWRQDCSTITVTEGCHLPKQSRTGGWVLNGWMNWKRQTTKLVAFNNQAYVYTNGRSY